jgi:hypothetical protein
MVHNLMEDDEGLAVTVKLSELRTVDTFLCGRVSDVLAVRIADMLVSERELTDATVLIERKQSEPGGLSYVAVGKVYGRICGH